MQQSYDLGDNECASDSRNFAADIHNQRKGDLLIYYELSTHRRMIADSAKR